MSEDRAVDSRRLRTGEAHRQSIERVIAVMRANFQEPLDLRRLAAVAGMSRYHFLRVFCAITGTSPIHFLACLRIERAKELLVETGMPVTGVCMEVGYSSLGSFSSSFTELVGLSPSEFRSLPGELTAGEVLGHLDRMVAHQSRGGSAWLEGELVSPFDYHGVHFVGTFRGGVPQGRPMAGTVMIAPGRFRIAAPAAGPFHLLAAAVPLSEVRAIKAVKPTVELVGGGQFTGRCADSGMLPPITLRRPRFTDPPIVVSLLALLAPPVRRRNPEEASFRGLR